MKSDERRDQILRAAEEVFAEKGFNGAALKDIADRVDIKTPGLYNYFRNKTDIYHSVIIERYRQMREVVLPPIEDTPDPAEKVRLLAELLVDFWAENPRFPKILAQAMLQDTEYSLNELAPAFLKPFFDELVGILAEGGVDEYGYGEYDISLLVFDIFGRTIFYFFAGGMLTELTGVDSFSPERIRKLKERTVDNLFEGIGIDRRAQS